LLAACQGIDFQAPLQTGVEARKAYALVREVSPVVHVDRPLAPDISAVAELIAAGKFQKLLA
jgi:histidine ammonia-lyase